MSHAANEQTILRWGFALVGLTLLALAAVSGAAAIDHMSRVGQICGAATAHCGWCYAAAGAALSGVWALAIALRPPRAKAVVRAARPRAVRNFRKIATDQG